MVFVPRPFPERLRERLTSFVGVRHHREAPDAIAWAFHTIRGSFEEAGWPVTGQPFPGPWGKGSNIIAARGREDLAAPTWILGAHYDMVPGSPGADDNGVAVAGLLEAARILSGVRFRDRVELVAWDMEEHQTSEAGALLGSRAMAGDCLRRNIRVGGVLDLEMIGFRSNEPGSQRFPGGFSLLFPRIMRRVRARETRGDFIAANGLPRRTMASMEKTSPGDSQRLPGSKSMPTETKKRTAKASRIERASDDTGRRTPGGHQRAPKVPQALLPGGPWSRWLAPCVQPTATLLLIFERRTDHHDRRFCRPTSAGRDRKMIMASSTILVVEDEPDGQDLPADNLRREGVDVLTSRSGRTCGFIPYGTESTRRLGTTPPTILPSQSP